MLKWLEENIGYDISLWFESWATDWVVTLFKPFDLVGTQLFYIVIICLLYWSVDKRKGRIIGTIFLFSCYLNEFFKLLLCRPRPYQVSVAGKPQVTCALKPLSSYGIPSGHTQTTITFFLALSLWMKKRLVWIISVFLICLVPLSRLIHRMHYLQDIVLGFILGLLIVLISYYGQPFYKRLYLRFGKGLIFACMAISIIALYVGAFFLNAKVWAKENIFEISTLFSVGLIGFLIEHYFVSFSSEGKLVKRIVRLIVGLLILLVLKFGMNFAFAPLKPAVKSEATTLYILFECIESMVLVLWITCGAPAIFVVTGLAYKEKR